MLSRWRLHLVAQQPVRERAPDHGDRNSDRRAIARIASSKLPRCRRHRDHAGALGERRASVLETARSRPVERTSSAVQCAPRATSISIQAEVHVARAPDRAAGGLGEIRIRDAQVREHVARSACRRGRRARRRAARRALCASGSGSARSAATALRNAAYSASSRGVYMREREDSQRPRALAFVYTSDAMLEDETVSVSGHLPPRRPGRRDTGLVRGRRAACCRRSAPATPAR